MTSRRRRRVRSSLDYPRRNSPHHWLHRRNPHSLDDRHHRGRDRPAPRTTRDGRTRGRRAETLLLTTGPGPAFAAVKAPKRGPVVGPGEHIGIAVAVTVP